MKKVLRALFAKKKYTIKQVKKVLKEQTLSGRYWNSKPSYNLFTAKVTIVGPSERVQISIIDGKGSYEDRDDDGCSEDRSCDMILKNKNEKSLKLFKVK